MHENIFKEIIILFKYIFMSYRCVFYYGYKNSVIILKGFNIWGYIKKEFMEESNGYYN